MSKSVAFIGGGNMARSIIGGMVADGWAADQIFVSEPNPAAREKMSAIAGICLVETNTAACSHGDVVVLATKPQVLRSVVEEIAAGMDSGRQLLLSIAAGIGCDQILAWCGQPMPLVRVMPNTPALVGEGASALFATAQVDDNQRSMAQSILAAVGITAWVSDESHMDAVTALSGSGPAYFFYLMELMQAKAVELGLDQELARLFTQQTGLGAARLAIHSGEPFAELRRQVTSPGGTTEAAITTMQARKMAEAVGAGLTAARDRSVELGKL